MSTPTLLCNSSLNIPQIKMYDFEKHLKNKTVVIDVREPHELQQIGQIPDTFNIPREYVNSFTILRKLCYGS